MMLNDSAWSRWTGRLTGENSGLRASHCARRVPGVNAETRKIRSAAESQAAGTNGVNFGQSVHAIPFTKSAAHQDHCTRLCHGRTGFSHTPVRKRKTA